MRNKLIAAGVGLFGYGVFIGWSIAADLTEKKWKERNDTLLDLVEYQVNRLEELTNLLESIPMTDEELEQIEEGRKQMEAENNLAPDSLDDITAHDSLPNGGLPVVGTTPDGNTAYSDADQVVESENTPVVPPGESPQETTSKLQAHIDRYVKDSDEAHDFESMIRVNELADQSPPFIISQGDYAVGEVDGEVFDKLAVTYYPTDRVLVHEEDESVVEDVNAVVGWGNLNSWGDQSGDPNVVFIRNHRLRTDYEVILDEEGRPPTHIIYGMDKDDYNVQNAAGTLRFRPEHM